MKLLMFAVHDRVTEAFGSPFTAQTEAEAKRMFLTAAQDPDTNLFKNPDDFSLYHIGSFNNAGGELVPQSPLVYLCGAGQLSNVRKISHAKDAS